MTARRLMPAVAASALLLAACTGVPTSSSPLVVKPLTVAQPTSSPVITPAPGADPRTMVQDFLAANAIADENHASARAFLTSDAKNRWSDNTVSVVDTTLVGNVTHGTVTVRGREIGSVSATGIYTPVRTGDGNGGVSVPSAFGMRLVRGEWRIDTLAPGLIVSYAEFQRIYQKRSIYFYDRTEKHLVPDLRYSSLTDPLSLANWLVRQLATGPRPELQNAWSRELPGQIDPGQVKVILGSPTTIAVPGASQLDAGTRSRLAGQLALTLDQVSSGSVMSILDNGRPVAVSAAGDTRFTAAEYRSTVGELTTPPALFYVHGGAVVDERGKPLPGELGAGADGLTSVALAGQLDSTDLLTAGTSGPDSDARLLVGTERTGLHATNLQGRLSRPTWAPDLDEVWIGDGSQVYRVTHRGKPTVVPVAGAAAGNEQVTALRFSPEGSRIAMVLTADDGGSAQVWVGSVVRTPGQSQVRVDSLEQISPQGVAVTDVAWNDQLTLFTIGRVISTGVTNVYEVQVDGSLWTPRSVVNLPDTPDSITVSAGVPAWVSVGGTVWVQTGRSWNGPDGQTTNGTNPTYLE